MRAFTKWSPVVVRSLLGLVFFVFGLNGFLHFLPMPPVPGPAGQFLGALAATGYMFPVVKGIEVLAGLALLTGRLVPLALVMLAPIVVNIALFHFVLTPGEVGMAAMVAAATAYLGWAYRGSYRGLFEVAAKPTAPREDASEGALPQAAE